MCCAPRPSPLTMRLAVIAMAAPFGPPALAEPVCLDYASHVHPDEVVPFGFNQGEIARHGHHLYVADRASGLHVFDASDPMAPVHLGIVPGTDDATSIDVDGGRAAMVGDVDGELGLWYFDLSTPAAPALIGGVGLGGNPWTVDLVGTIAYVVGDDGMLWIVGSPASPSVLATRELGGWSLHVEFGGGLLAVMNDDRGVVLLDVTNPTSPVVRGEVMIEDPMASSIRGSTIWVASARALSVVDASDPTNPTLGETHELAFRPRRFVPLGDQVILVGEYTWYTLEDAGGNPEITHTWPHEYAQDAVVVDDVLISVAPFMDGLVLTDVSTFDTPAPIGTYGSGFQKRDSHRVGSLIHKLDRHRGIRTIDVSDPTHPVDLANQRPVVIDDATGITVRDDVAYVATDDGLHTFDISDPGEIEEISYLSLDEHVGYQLFFHGDYLLVPQYTRVSVIDVTGPVPEIVYNLDFEGAFSLSPRGDLLYVSASPDGLFRNADLFVLQQFPGGVYAEVNRVHTDFPIRELAFEGDHAYTGGLAVFDVSIPTLPVLVAGWPGLDPDRWEFEARTVVHDGVVYASSLSDGVQVFDVSDPLNPDLIGRAFADGGGTIDTDGEVLHVTCQDPGLLVYPLDCRSFVSVEPGTTVSPVARWLAVPTPFRTRVRIERVEPGATVTIVDAAGREVAARVASDAGVVRWDGRGADDRTVAPGPYFASSGRRSWRLLFTP